MKRWRVWLRSKPGVWETYDGYVDVLADDSETAVEEAIAELQRKSFVGRGRDAWVVVRTERLGQILSGPHAMEWFVPGYRRPETRDDSGWANEEEDQ